MRSPRWIAVVLMVLWPAAAGADSAVTDIVNAARRGDGHAVHKILELTPEAASATDNNGFTALHWAGIRGHWRIFAELVAAGAPVNAVGGDGGTPLHWACHHDRPEMVALLLDAGAEPGLVNRWGRTPLHVASRRGCARVAALLIDRGADLEAVTREGWTPLAVAYRSGHEGLVKLLLERGADPGHGDGADVLPAAAARPRPPGLCLDAELLDEYVGLYELGDGLRVKVWREADGLHLREFAPDRLYPVDRDRFACVQEPWNVRFVRDDGGRVSAVEIDFLRTSVRATRMEAPRYVGSGLCISCHSGAASGHQDIRWLQSRHGHAYWRLGADWARYLARMRPHYQDLERPMEDERCRLCHVTGAQDDDALFASSFRVDEGVGCEACHGPGSEYADRELMADRERFLAAGGVVPDETTCRSCHRNSEQFDYAEWWPKIAHPLPAAAAAASG